MGAQYYPLKNPDKWVTSGGLGTMGFDFQQRIGAQIAKRDELVIAIVGDAGFQMTLQELSVLKEHALPVKVFILNNEALGMVRQWQDEFYNQRYSHSLLPCQPDFVALANAYGIKGVRIDDPLLAKKQIQHAIELQEPVVIDCRVLQSEKVMPMVAPGKGVHQMEGVEKGEENCYSDSSKSKWCVKPNYRVMTRRHFNIESISVGHTESSDISRMTIVVHVESEQQVEQLIKQLHKQIDVLKVSDITEEAMIARELALIKVATSVARAELYSLIEPFRAAVIDVGKDSIVVQVTGTQDKVEALIELLRPYGLKEIARTGVTAFTRSMKTR